jgi:hypothetical protein
MSRRDPPEGFFIALMAVLLLALALALTAPTAASAGPGPELPAPGLSCTLSDAWFGATVENPQDRRPWPVRVVKLQGLPTAEPGAWVQPLHGRYTAYQFQVAQARLTECRP